MAVLNLARRHLTDAQKVRIGMAIELDLAAEAKARMLAGQKTDPPENLPEGRGPRTSDVVAGKLGIGTGRTYQEHKKVLTEPGQYPTLTYNLPYPQGVPTRSDRSKVEHSEGAMIALVPRSDAFVREPRIGAIRAISRSELPEVGTRPLTKPAAWRRG